MLRGLTIFFVFSFLYVTHLPGPGTGQWTGLGTGNLFHLTWQTHGIDISTDYLCCLVRGIEMKIVSRPDILVVPGLVIKIN